jgi:hypothetical protein
MICFGDIDGNETISVTRVDVFLQHPRIGAPLLNEFEREASLFQAFTSYG